MTITALPTEKSQPKIDPKDMVVFIYGDPKIGKSSFCANADGPLFLATEPGLNHLSVYQIPIVTWPDFLDACRLIHSGNHQFRTIVIDTIDNLYIMCRHYVLQTKGWAHEQDGGFGKGYDAVRDEFRKMLLFLAMMPYGLMMTSHAEENDVKTPTGLQKKINCTLNKRVRPMVTGMADILIYAETVEIHDAQGTITGYERVIHTHPSTIYEAGIRSKKGVVLPDPLPLDYHAFAAAVRGEVRNETKTEQIIVEPAVDGNVPGDTATNTAASDEHYDPFTQDQLNQ